MVHFKVYSIFSVICCVVILGRGEDINISDNSTGKGALKETIPIDPKTIDTINTSTITPSTPILISNSEHSTTNAQTKKPPTTTSTTTTPSTTTPSTTTSTTSKTTTSTTTTPPIPLEQGTWWYTNKTTNVTCVLVQFAAELNVTYIIFDKNATKMEHVILNVPKDAQVINGSCGETEQWLKLSWPNNTMENNLTMVFRKNDTQQYLEYFKIALSPQHFPNAQLNTTFELLHNGSEWMTPLSTSYRCSPASKLVLSGSQYVPVGAVTLTDLQEEAFRKDDAKKFSAARDCGSGDVPDAVPIAVGCALGGMVAVVLIAYLVGRRRSAARGYLSM